MGSATVSELHRILNHLQPQVVFLEVPTSGYAGDGMRLEDRAIELYRLKNSVELVPVDLPTPNAEFFRNDEHLHNRVEQSSREFCRLCDWSSAYIRRYGFAYLNSKHSAKLWSDLDQEMIATVAKLADPRLGELLDLRTQIMERRDVEMLTNILKYARETTLERGVFLVGASHRKSIIEKSQKDGILNPHVQWDYFETLEQEDSETSSRHYYQRPE